MITESINNALDVSKDFEKEFRSRELSLVITKLEEASHWAEALRRKKEAEAEAQEFAASDRPSPRR